MSKDKEKTVTKKSEPFQVVVASIVDHPITIIYDGVCVRISGRERVQFEDGSLLQPVLPIGLHLKKV